MAQCFNCGIEDTKVFLFDCILQNGIGKVCRQCSIKEKVLVIKNPHRIIPELDNKSKERQTVRDRLERISGTRVFGSVTKSLENPNDVELRKIVDENTQVQVQNLKPQIYEDLVKNFHWIIMRARRMRKWTQSDFAQKIEEPLALIKMVEQGTLPEKYEKLIKKIEDKLRIALFKKQFSFNNFEDEKEKLKELFLKDAQNNKIDFDERTTKTLTIADLKQMKKEKEQDIFESEKIQEDLVSKEDMKIISQDLDKVEKDLEEKDRLLNKKDLTQEEMNKIIFGK